MSQNDWRTFDSQAEEIIPEFLIEIELLLCFHFQGPDQAVKHKVKPNMWGFSFLRRGVGVIFSDLL